MYNTNWLLSLEYTLSFYNACIICFNGHSISFFLFEVPRHMKIVCNGFRATRSPRLFKKNHFYSLIHVFIQLNLKKIDKNNKILLALKAQSVNEVGDASRKGNAPGSTDNAFKSLGDKAIDYYNQCNNCQRSGRQAWRG